MIGKIPEIVQENHSQSQFYQQCIVFGVKNAKNEIKNVLMHCEMIVGGTGYQKYEIVRFTKHTQFRLMIKIFRFAFTRTAKEKALPMELHF